LFPLTQRLGLLLQSKKQTNKQTSKQTKPKTNQSKTKQIPPDTQIPKPLAKPEEKKGEAGTGKTTTTTRKPVYFSYY